MGTQVIKQPNGLFALFSSQVDDFVMLNATEQDVQDYFEKAERERIAQALQRIFLKIDRGEPAYMNWTLTFDEAKQKAIDRHGDKVEWLPVVEEIENEAHKMDSEESTEL